MRSPIKRIGKFVGTAVAREAGFIPDKRFVMTEDLRADLIQIVAEGVYLALEQYGKEQEEREAFIEASRLEPSQPQ